MKQFPYTLLEVPAVFKFEVAKTLPSTKNYNFCYKSYLTKKSFNAIESRENIEIYVGEKMHTKLFCQEYSFSYVFLYGSVSSGRELALSYVIFFKS